MLVNFPEYWEPIRQYGDPKCVRCFANDDGLTIPDRSARVSYRDDRPYLGLASAHATRLQVSLWAR
jgi:hypothetical protein